LGATGIIECRQTYHKLLEKNVHPFGILLKPKYKTLWQRYGSIDKAIEYEAKEFAVRVPGYRKRLASILQVISSTDTEKVPESPDNWKSECQALRSTSRQLSHSPLPEKQVAAILLRTAKDMLLIGRVDKAASQIRKADKMLSYRRRQAARIYRYLNSSILSEIREQTARQNQLLLNQVRAIEASIPPSPEQPLGHYQWGKLMSRVIGNSSEMLQPGKAPWLNEPEYRGVSNALRKVLAQGKIIANAHLAAIDPDQLKPVNLTQVRQAHTELRKYAGFIEQKVRDAEQLRENMVTIRTRMLDGVLKLKDPLEKSRKQAFLNTITELEQARESPKEAAIILSFSRRLYTGFCFDPQAAQGF